MLLITRITFDQGSLSSAHPFVIKIEWADNRSDAGDSSLYCSAVKRDKRERPADCKWKSHLLPPASVRIVSGGSFALARIDRCTKRIHFNQVQQRLSSALPNIKKNAIAVNGLPWQRRLLRKRLIHSNAISRMSWWERNSLTDQKSSEEICRYVITADAITILAVSATPLWTFKIHNWKLERENDKFDFSKLVGAFVN